MLSLTPENSAEKKSGFIASYISDTEIFRHYHGEYELVLSIMGHGTRIVGDSVEIFDHYDLVLIGTSLPHAWNYYPEEDMVPENRGIILHFDLASIGEELLSQHELHPFRQLLVEAERGIAFSVEDAKKAEVFLRNMVRTRGLEKLINFFSVMKILCSSEKRRYLCSAGYSFVDDENAHEKISEVYSFIKTNYGKPITLDDASRLTGMSPSALSRYFKKQSGSCFVDFLTSIRINRACYLLRETEYPVNQICEECGFQSISNFNKHFRKAEGLSPREYRAANRNEMKNEAEKS